MQELSEYRFHLNRHRRSWKPLSCGALVMCIGAFSHNAIASESFKAQAQEAVRCAHPLSLQQFRAFALSHSPLVGEIDQGYAEKLATAFETEALQNPEIQGESTRFLNGRTDADGAEHELSIAQPLRLSDFSVRSKVAALLRSTGDAERRTRLLELTQQLTVQYHALLTLERSHTLLERSAKRAETQMHGIRDGVRKGLLSSGDEKLFEGEMYRLQGEALRVRADLEALRGELSQKVGSPCLLVIKDEGSSRGAEKNLPSLAELVRRADGSPLSESGRIRGVLELIHEGERVAELDATPSITPYLTYSKASDGGEFAGVGVTVPLPFWNRNEGERARRGAERRVAERRASFLRDGGLHTQIAALRSATEREWSQAELYRTKVVPAFEEALKSQQKLYSEGRGGVLQVWQTLRAYNEVELQSIELELRVVVKKAALSLLIGEEFGGV